MKSALQTHPCFGKWDLTRENKTGGDIPPPVHQKTIY
jgi:hypothetical protein